MVNINLIKPEMSDVPYELTTFPDGEPHIKFIGDIDRKTNYKVICRIKNPTDLFVLMQVGDILKRQFVELELDIIYLMSMRMDRVITFNEAFTLDIVAQVINDMDAKKVRIFHCHSERAFSLIRNSVDMEQDYNKNLCFEGFDESVTCYPDAGAMLRYAYGLNGDENYIQLEKKRDLNDKGKIVSLEIVHECTDTNPKIITIEDDLCDGGGTFVLASKILREKYPNSKLYIFVRHLVNPVGLKNLSENFDKVYITNSYADWSNGFDNVESVDVMKLFY